MLSRFGGLGGVRHPPLVVETETLPEAAAARLVELARRLPQSGEQAVFRKEPASPDAFGYELEITDAGQTSMISFDHRSAPPELSELVSELRVLARRSP